MSKLNIESEKVLAAAKDCSQAKKVLETLFPKVFNDEAKRLKKLEESNKYFDIAALKTDFNYLFPYKKVLKAGFLDPAFMQVRCSGEFDGKAFYLDSRVCNWKLVTDKAGELCLVPTKKQSWRTLFGSYKKVLTSTK